MTTNTFCAPPLDRAVGALDGVGEGDGVGEEVADGVGDEVLVVVGFGALAGCWLVPQPARATTSAAAQPAEVARKRPVVTVLVLRDAASGRQRRTTHLSAT
jgi:hypothetical protein